VAPSEEASMISLLNASKGHNPALIIIIIKVLKNLIKRRDSNSGPSYYEADGLTNTPRHTRYTSM
jgi:hypothetical protein